MAKYKDMLKIKIKDKIYTVELAITDEEKEVGLQGHGPLKDDEGMLFVYEEPEDEVSYWMVDCDFNLDLIFINEESEVVKVATGYANSDKAHTATDISFVLELKQGSGVKVGDKIEALEDLDETDLEDDVENIEEIDLDEVESPEEMMMILNAKGESQMDLNGGERIFSRKNTVSLLKFAKRAYTNKSKNSYITLGRKVFSFMDAQDERGNDYVELPK